MSEPPPPSDGPGRDRALTRRHVLARAGFAGVALGSGALDAGDALAALKPPPRPRTPAQALRALQLGNRRYVSGNIKRLDYSRLGNRIAETQKPFAAIVTCADSRISPPVIFDVGLGTLFSSRVAGNSADTGTIGSTEYAVLELGVLLVVVLGHSDCGAVKAAIKVANGKASFPRTKFGALGPMIRPVVGAVKTMPKKQRTLSRSIAVNARIQARRLAAAGPIINRAVASGRVQVVAAVYDIRSGRVSLVGP
jgi:carbonic anhydrase